VNPRLSEIARGIGALVLVAAVAALWVSPTMFFQQPAPRGEIGAAAWEFPIFALIALAAVVALIFRKRWPAVPISFGVYLLGVGADLLLGYFGFGNSSDDRYMPLVVLPFLVGFAGLVSLLAGVMAKRRLWRHVWLGAIVGLAATVVVGVWVLQRGAPDWLLAPYGFDITLLVAVLAVAVIAIGSIIRRGPSTPEHQSLSAHRLGAESSVK
jgi:hypothetical protein